MRHFSSMLWMLCVWVAGPLHAGQDPHAQWPLPQQADSLEALILDTNDPDAVIALSRRLLKVAEVLNDDEKAAFAFRQMAWAHKQKEDFGASIRHYFAAEKLYHRLQDTIDLGKVYLNIGQLFARARENDKALQYLEQAKNQYKLAEDWYRMSGALYEMGTRYLEKGEPGKAAKYYQEALAICPEKKLSRMSMIYNRLGWVAKDLGDYEKARKYYRQALSMLDDSPKWDKKRAIAYNNIGESFLLEGRHDSVDYWLQRALAAKEALDDPESSLETLLQMARLTYRRGNPAEARQLLDQGIALIDPAKINQKLTEALALVTSIIHDPENTGPVPATDLKRYLALQQQQLTALHDLRDELDTYNIHASHDLYDHEIQNKTLQASVTNRTVTLGGTSAFLLVLVAIGFVYTKKHKRAKKHAIHDKDAFIHEQVKNYDEQILRMLLVKAGYEDIKDKLKKDFGLEDDDFGGD